MVLRTTDPTDGNATDSWTYVLGTGDAAARHDGNFSNATVDSLVVAADRRSALVRVPLLHEAADEGNQLRAVLNQAPPPSESGYACM